jgi:hypothetical protein
MKLYTGTDKRAQLNAFVHALRDAIAAGDVEANRQINLEPLVTCLSKAEALLRNGFDWDALKAVANSFTPVLWIHKEWVPPLHRNDDGTFSEPEWFTRMSDAHGRAQQLALELRSYGER